MDVDIKRIRAMIVERRNSLQMLELLLDKEKKEDSPLQFFIHRHILANKVRLQQLQELETKAFKQLAVDDAQRMKAHERELRSMLIQLKAELITEFKKIRDELSKGGNQD